MAGPTPSLEQVTDALIAVIAADLRAASNASTLQPVLSQYGVSISTALSQDDSGEFVAIKHGDRDLLRRMLGLRDPRGRAARLHVQSRRREGGLFDHGPDLLAGRAEPSSYADAGITPQVPDVDQLRDDEPALADGLGAPGGGWSVSGGTVMIYDPAYSLTIFDQAELQGKVAYFTEIAWQGTVYFTGP